MKEESSYKSRDVIMKKAKPLHKHLYKNLLKKDTSGDVNEVTKYDKYDSEKKRSLPKQRSKDEIWQIL